MKNLVITLGICLVLIGTGAWLLFGQSETGAVGSIGTTNVPIRVIEKGSHALLVQARKNYRIQDEHEFEEIWNLAYGADGPDLPQVDFSKDEVLAVFEGRQPTGGHSITVGAVDERDGKRIVHIVHKSPDASCVVTQEESVPFEIVVIPIGGEELAHTDEELLLSCN
jgi:hypothetical protein